MRRERGSAPRSPLPAPSSSPSSSRCFALVKWKSNARLRLRSRRPAYSNWNALCYRHQSRSMPAPAGLSFLIPFGSFNSTCQFPTLSVANPICIYVSTAIRREQSRFLLITHIPRLLSIIIINRARRDHRHHFGRRLSHHPHSCLRRFRVRGGGERTFLKI